MKFGKQKYINSIKQKHIKVHKAYTKGIKRQSKKGSTKSMTDMESPYIYLLTHNKRLQRNMDLSARSDFAFK